MTGAELHKGFLTLCRKYGVRDETELGSTFLANLWFASIYEPKSLEQTLPVEALEHLLENSTDNRHKLEKIINDRKGDHAKTKTAQSENASEPR